MPSCCSAAAASQRPPPSGHRRRPSRPPGSRAEPQAPPPDNDGIPFTEEPIRWSRYRQPIRAGVSIDPDGRGRRSGRRADRRCLRGRRPIPAGGRADARALAPADTGGRVADRRAAIEAQRTSPPRREGHGVPASSSDGKPRRAPYPQLTPERAAVGIYPGMPTHGQGRTASSREEGDSSSSPSWTRACTRWAFSTSDPDLVDEVIEQSEAIEQRGTVPIRRGRAERGGLLLDAAHGPGRALLQRRGRRARRRAGSACPGLTGMADPTERVTTYATARGSQGMRPC